MNISYEGIGYLGVTFPAEKDVTGQVCAMGDDGRVTSCSTGDCFIGVMESYRDGRAAVQLHGFAKVRYTGSNLSLGFSMLSGDGGGGVKMNVDGREYLVVQVDTAAKTAVIEL